MNYDVGVVRRRRVIAPSEAYFAAPPSAASYVGPGDIVATGWYLWGGVRAFNAAYATGSNPALDIVDQAGANPLTANILASGFLDATSISAWVAAHSVTTILVSKLYDQTGNGRHLTQATNANRPSLNLTGGPSSGPAIAFVSASSQFLNRAQGVGDALNQGFSLSTVCNYTNGQDGSGHDLFGASDFNNYQIEMIFNHFTAVEVALQANLAGPSSTPEAPWKAFQCVFNGANSIIVNDGSAGTAANAGSQNIGTAGNIALGCLADGAHGQFFGGLCAEFGLNSGVFSTGGGSQSTLINSNQHGANGYNF